jgi:ABC-type lipoprotein export system ATPase subunit
MVGPAGSGKVDLLSVWVEALQESTSDSQSTGTGNGLSDDETVLLDDGGVAAICQLRSSLGEGRNTSDTGVFFVET